MELDGARREISTLLNSKAFATSETHRRLLEYLAAKSLSGATDHLKEHTIGIEALGKPASYDPQEDSIVRTQISRLRLKLLDYYQSDGKNDPVRVEIPKGGFRLEFHLRDNAAPALSIDGDGSVESAVAAQNRKRTALAILPWVLCGILTVVCVVLGNAVFLQREHAIAKAPWPLSRVVNAGQQTTVVLADAGFSRLRSLSRKNITLEEYLGNDYPKLLTPPDPTPSESALVDSFTRWPVLSQTEAETLKTIVALSWPFESRVSVRSAHDLRPRDLMDQNLILLGAPTSNPWVSRFCKFLNFQFIETADGTGKYFLNQKPKPGESPTYAGLTKTGSNGWAYATLALVPNDRSNGGVLILQGLQREGTVAAGLFLADEQNRAALRRVLVSANADPEKAWFEVLIRADSIAAVPGQIQIVAVRVVRTM
jgi:hypothetical protein